MTKEQLYAFGKDMAYRGMNRGNAWLATLALARQLRDSVVDMNAAHTCIMDGYEYHTEHSLGS